MNRIASIDDRFPIAIRVVASQRHPGVRCWYGRWKDIEGGQEIFLKYALMQNGSIWGDGTCLGPDFSAQYLHKLSMDAGEPLARHVYFLMAMGFWNCAAA